MYKAVALGGTFDHFHRGHRAMIDKAFEVGSHVIIGITSDEFVKKLYKSIDWPFQMRLEAVKNYVDTRYPNRTYELVELNDYFGPAAHRAEVEVLVVSPGTVERLDLLNRLRMEKGLQPVVSVLVPYVMAEDGIPISSSRIRGGEIDEEGRIVD